MIFERFKFIRVLTLTLSYTVFNCLMPRIDYTSDAFPSIFMDESVEAQGQVYKNYSLDDLETIVETLDLSPTVQDQIFSLVQGLQDLVTLAGNSLVESDPSLVAVQFTEGLPSRAYAPALFQSKPQDDGSTFLALKIGNNIIKVEVTTNDDDVTSYNFGKLKGDAPKLVTKKSADGLKDFLTASVKFKSPSGDFYIIPCILDGDYKESDIDEALDAGEPLEQYLRVIGSGKSYLRLKDLELGVYPILDVLEPPRKQFGRFELVLAEGNVTPNASLNRDMEAWYSNMEAGLSGEMIFEEFRNFFKARTLNIISKIEKDNKVYVTAKFVKLNKAKLKGSTASKSIAPAKADIVVAATSSVSNVTDDFPI